MMDLATLGKLIGDRGATALAPLALGYMLFVPGDEYNRHVAESERGYILEVVEKAREVPDGDYKSSLCRTLEDAIGRLCASAPDDALCMDRKALRERAGCPQ